MHHEDRVVDQRAEWDLREGRREELEELLGCGTQRDSDSWSTIF